ncbi:MAG: ABC transporter permease [Bacteroidetes bacterium]|nr:ABC transporter permease [Bacteroidota bacterium]
MNISSSAKIAFKALGKNKFRSFLTMLGIIIGVVSVIVMQAIGKGSSADVNARISSLGTNLITISPISARSGGVNLDAGSAVSLKKEDADYLLKEVPTIDAVSPLVRTSAQMKYGNKNWRSTINGVYPGYFTIRVLEIKDGTIFTKEDEKKLNKVCVIGKTVQDNLFGPGVDPIGKTIRVGTIPYLVIGTIVSKGTSGGGQDQDDIVLAPYSTVQNRMLGSDNVNQIFASAKTEGDVNTAVKQIEEALRVQHKLLPNQANNFNISTQLQIRETLNTVVDTITVLLSIVAAISLVVGGIGIMNIMLVSVTERTREIGTRMAVGATGIDVQFQLLLEAIVLSLTGGVTGILLGLLTAFLVSKFGGYSTIVAPESIIISFVVSTLIGVFFGWYPSRKAANLNPIDALRYE